LSISIKQAHSPALRIFEEDLRRRMAEEPRLAVGKRQHGTILSHYGIDEN
jgi:hypothetical protein